jgi:hypothetical protein
MLTGVHVRVRTPDELQAEALRTAKEQGPRFVPFLLARDRHPRTGDPVPEAGPLADSDRYVIDPGGGLALLGVSETQDLVTEHEEGVVRPLPNDVHAQLFHEEPTSLVPVADLDVHVVEPHQTKISGRWTGGHVRRSPPKPYILSVRRKGPARVLRPSGGRIRGSCQTAATALS